MTFLYQKRKQPLVIAHRGASHEAPENTLSAFKKAREVGADGVELDILQSKDGHLVVVHDERLNRLCKIPGWIEHLTLKELKKLDFGSHFSQQFKGEEIPTLEEVFKLLKGDLLINVEIKGRKIRDDGREEKLIKLIHRKKMMDQILVSSFNFFALHRLHLLAPEIKRGYLFFERQLAHKKLGNWSKFLKPYSLNISKELTHEYPVNEVHKKGIKYWVWTVDDEEEMRHFCEQKVDAIITNEPAKLIHLLKNEKG